MNKTEFHDGTSPYVNAAFLNGLQDTIEQRTEGTADKVAVYDANGVMSESVVTAMELSRLSGVTGNVQTQINGKAAATHTHTGTYAPLSHEHAAAVITSGELPIIRGGSGASTKNGARANFGITSGSETPSNSFGTDGDIYFKYEA